MLKCQRAVEACGIHGGIEMLICKYSFWETQIWNYKHVMMYKYIYKYNMNHTHIIYRYHWRTKIKIVWVWKQEVKLQTRKWFQTFHISSLFSSTGALTHPKAPQTRALEVYDEVNQTKVLIKSILGMRLMHLLSMMILLNCCPPAMLVDTAQRYYRKISSYIVCSYISYFSA